MLTQIEILHHCSPLSEITSPPQHSEVSFPKEALTPPIGIFSINSKEVGRPQILSFMPVHLACNHGGCLMWMQLHNDAPCSRPLTQVTVGDEERGNDRVGNQPPCHLEIGANPDNI